MGKGKYTQRDVENIKRELEAEKVNRVAAERIVKDAQEELERAKAKLARHTEKAAELHAVLKYGFGEKVSL